jgi:hypothetical protein
MRASRKNKAIYLMLFICAFFSLRATADDYGVSVTNANLDISGDIYVLTAAINFKLSNKAIEALKNGVPLFWTYQFTLQEHRSLMWNKNLVDKKIRYRIQYHALLNTYRVRNEDSGAMTNSTSLETALDTLGTIRAMPFVEKNKIAGDEDYVAGIKINFDRDALPLPLRPVAYMNPQWYLSSDWYTWTLKK